MSFVNVLALSGSHSRMLDVKILHVPPAGGCIVTLQDVR